MSSRIDDDYKIPLEELRARFPEPTQIWIEDTIFKIRLYFWLWVIFFLAAAVFVWFIIHLHPAEESIDKWVQRSGPLIVLLTGFGESVFIVKLKNLAEVRHWAHLSCEIYIERRYKRYLVVSLVISGIFVLVGSVIGGYGDILYNELRRMLSAKAL